MRLLSALLLVTLVGSFAIVQAKPSLTSRCDGAIKLHDGNGNGKIEWSEVQQTNATYEVRQADAEAAKDPATALEQVQLEFEHRLDLMQFLLADGNHDLVVTSAEIRKFLRLIDKDKQPQPELWHYEQITKLWLDEHWEELLELMDDDQDGLISFLELSQNYPAKLKLTDVQPSDTNKDGKFSRSEYATFKATERLAGVFIDELENSVGVSGGTSESRGNEADDDAETEKDYEYEDHRKTEAAPNAKDDRELKPGSSWQYRVKYDGKESYTWNRVVYLNGKWLDGQTGDADAYLFRVQHRSFDEDTPEEWPEPADGRVNGGSWSGGKGFKWARDNGTLTTIKVPAGEFKCVKQTSSVSGGKNVKSRSGVRYYIEISGIPVLVREETSDGKVVGELMKFNP